MRNQSFLKIATVVAILGLVLGFLLAIARRLILAFYPLNANRSWFNSVFIVSELIIATIPLIILFVAFLLNIKSKQS